MTESHLERLFRRQLEGQGIGGFQQEVEFHPERKWRWDFAWPDRMIAVEIQGGTEKHYLGDQSHHSTPQGYRNDLEKQREGQRLGWQVFAFTGLEVRNLSALRFLVGVMGEIEKNDNWRATKYEQNEF